MISVNPDDLACLLAGKRPRLEVGHLPYEVSKFFGTSKSTVMLSKESARHIIDEHGDHIGLHELAMLPTMLQRGGWNNDRLNHCTVTYFSSEHDWHFHAVVKVTSDRRESLVVSLRRSRKKSVRRNFSKGTKLRNHW